MKKTETLLIILLIVFSALYSNEKKMIKGLSYCGFRDADIMIPSVVSRPDSFTFKTVADLLSNPLKSEFTAEEIVRYAENFDYWNLYRFATGLHKKPKSGLKEEKDFLRILSDKQAPSLQMSFIYDTSLTDSQYFSYARMFLAACPLSGESKLESRLKAAQILLEADSGELMSIAKRLSDEYPDDVYIADGSSQPISTEKQIIIGSIRNDTYILKNCNRIIIDPAGDDIYLSSESFTAGCATDCISFISDLKGNDTYISKEFSLGVGIKSGVGFIDDRCGNDIYNGGFASMGAGFSGVGMLIDRGGNDRYTASGFAQGFGFTKGIGILNDFSGDDIFTVAGGIPDHREEGYHSHLSQGFGFGIRDIAGGGIGALMDFSGNDRYFGEYFVQGSSYWYALGLLYDRNGDDSYTARRYSQGAGTHFTTGILSDRGGNDSYTSWGVSQGCGHDYSNGVLLDYSGDDNYSSVWLSQGAGNANGNGILIDFSGNDNYNHEKTDGQGWGNEDRMTYSFGMLYDCSGDDHFNMKRVSTMIKGAKGVLIDEED